VREPERDVVDRIIEYRRLIGGPSTGYGHLKVVDG